MGKYLMMLLLLFPLMSNASLKYEIISSEIKPFVSKSFGDGYMGLQQPPQEPGYGLFFTVRVFSTDQKEIIDFLSVDGDGMTKLVCKNNALKSLVDSLYTVNVTYLDQAGDAVIGTMINKNSCLNYLMKR